MLGMRGARIRTASLLQYESIRICLHCQSFSGRLSIAGLMSLRMVWAPANQRNWFCRHSWFVGLHDLLFMQQPRACSHARIGRFIVFLLLSWPPTRLVGACCISVSVEV